VFDTEYSGCKPCHSISPWEEGELFLLMMSVSKCLLVMTPEVLVGTPYSFHLRGQDQGSHVTSMTNLARPAAD